MISVKVTHFKADCDVLLLLSFIASYIITYIAVGEIHLVTMLLTI